MFICQFGFGQSMTCANKTVTLNVIDKTGNIISVELNRTNTGFPIDGPESRFRFMNLTGGSCVSCDNLAVGEATKVWKIKDTSGNAQLEFTSNTGCAGTSMNLSKKSMTCSTRFMTVTLRERTDDIAILDVSRTKTNLQFNSPSSHAYRVIDLTGGKCIECGNLKVGEANKVWKIRDTSGNAKLTFSPQTTQCGDISMILK